MDISETQALHATYVAGVLSAVLLSLRLLLSVRTPHFLDASFFVTLVALAVILGRTLVRHFSLSYGTASDAIRQIRLDPNYEPNMAHIRTAAALSISGRILLTTHLWAMCLLLLLTYRRFVRHLPWISRAVQVIYATMAITWVVTTALNLFECHPFSKYYQVRPDPGVCLRAYAQTLMQCVSNILLDLAIMAISIPILHIQTGDVMLRLRLAVLISLGAICIIATALRAVYIFRTGSAQPARDLWAAVTVLVSTVVANAPFLYGAVGRWRMGKRDRSTFRVYDGTEGGGTHTAKVMTGKGGGSEEGIYKETSTTLVVEERIRTEGDEIELLRVRR
ncbi:hypothetical protein CAC42_316 [Sphaceloma murrayae]|uniref:Rhodopsin domain-containing protein n=1 Tax=Sphaceloma murrayae TaxID=2082308 RepID=A0A2K1QZW7_9PEZI|nr:hypothetical protein CAC42_316 [Sphaceloma murrayae]